MKYKRYISFITLQWIYTWKAFLGIVLFMMVGELYFLRQNFKNTVYQAGDWWYGERTMELTWWAPRFEEFLASSHFKVLFLTALCLTTILIISVPFRQSMSSKSDYTYIRLPLGKEESYILRGIHAFSHYLILIGAQYGMILVGYAMYLYYVPKEAQMTQAFFLAFVRWDFLRVVFPVVDIVRFIYNILLLINVALITVYLPLCIQTKNKRIIPIWVCGYLYATWFQEIKLVWLIVSGAVLVIMSLAMIHNAKVFLETE